jgi:uncharacterized membrane protein
VKHRLSLIFLLILIFWALFALFFKVNNWQNHDGNFHLQRGFAAIESLKSGQFPLRWSSLLNYGCGLPVFNFFYPLIYYFFGILSLFNLDLIISFKIILSLFYILGTLSFYFLIYFLSKSRNAALIGAVLFAINPYYLQLIYVRANPELLTYCLFPLILLLITKQKYIPLYFCLILFFLSHNTTVLITLPFILYFIGYQIVKTKKIDKFLIITFILAVISSSFFLGPALLEKKYIKLGTSIAADYQQHFPTLKQLFISPWGWGYSNTGSNDGMSFKFGYIQWIIFFLALTISIFRRRLLYILIPLFLCIFLTLSPSKFIWEHIPLLQQLQYPWRLLGLSVLMVSFLGPWLYIQFSSNLKYIFLVLVILCSILSNRNHIQAVPSLENPDITRIGSTTIADELLPISSKTDCYQDSHKLTYFPGTYSISVNQRPAAYHDCSGYVCLESGDTSTDNFTWQYQSTPIQKLFNYLSLFSFILWFIFASFKRK